MPFKDIQANWPDHLFQANWSTVQANESARVQSLFVAHPLKAYWACRLKLAPTIFEPKN